MDNKPKILLIVEGENDEPAFFSNLASCFGMDCEIVSFRTNIYGLYRRMEKLGFEANIVDVLRDNPSLTEGERRDLDHRFAYVYLVFDFDIQHGSKPNQIHRARIIENIEKVKTMAAYFTNETDPTVGKLYINFPMFEGLFDCGNLKEPFKVRFCPLEKLPTYKSAVRKGSSSKYLAGKYEREDFLLVAKNSVNSLSYLLTRKLLRLTYEEYRRVTMEKIVEKEGELTTDEASQSILVLPTSSFFLIDYFGNNNGFYEATIASIDHEGE